MRVRNVKFTSASRFQILEVCPKTPSEALAKDLRQTRLTVDRLECEKKELQHKISSQAGGAAR